MATLQDMPVWVYFERDPQLHGVWATHVLEFDLVTMGSTLVEAMDMAMDATVTALAEILSHPNAFQILATQRAPEECWAKLWALFEKAPARRLTDIVEQEDKCSAMGIQIQIPAAAVLSRMAGENDEPVHVSVGMPIAGVRLWA